jgi:hypothetical protein
MLHQSSTVIIGAGSVTVRALTGDHNRRQQAVSLHWYCSVVQQALLCNGAATETPNCH